MVVVLHRAFDPGLALADIEKHGCTVMFGAPAMFLFMAQQPQFETTDLSSLRMLIVGAAPVPKSQLKIYGARNVALTQGYGLTVLPVYWNRPEATAEAIDSEGWFHTGDAGYMDDEGFLFISDRVKDMVISGGENVYPAEVESVLFEHPAIAEVAVIGLPDDKWGEAVTADVD